MNDKLRKNVKNVIYQVIKEVDSSMSSSFAKKIEGELYKQYPDPCSYSKKLITLLIFIDPNGVYGSFAKAFREKLVSGVYSPKALVKLDIPDFLPEIYNNPEIELATKLELNQLLYNEILKNKLVEKFEKNGGKGDGDSDGEKEITINDLCENKMWNEKPIDIIVCKQNNRFYCLRVDKLMEQIKQNFAATNYINGKPLSVEIINNLQKKYDMTASNESDSDFESESGSDSESESDSGSYSDSDNEIENVIQEIVDESPSPSEENSPKPEKPTKTNDFIKNEVMIKDSVIRELYSNYSNRLRIVLDIIVGRLKKSVNPNERGELNDKLEETRQQLEKLRESAKTIDGLIMLLESALDHSNKQLLEMNGITIMDIIYPGEESINQPEKITLEKNIERYTNEIARLANLKNVGS